MKIYTFIVEQTDKYSAEISMMGNSEKEARTKLQDDLEKEPLDARKNTLECISITVKRKTKRSKV